MDEPVPKGIKQQIDLGVEAFRAQFFANNEQQQEKRQAANTLTGNTKRKHQSTSNTYGIWRRTAKYAHLFKKYFKFSNSFTLALELKNQKLAEQQESSYAWHLQVWKM